MQTMVLSQLDSLRRELVTAAHDSFSRIIFGKVIHVAILPQVSKSLDALVA